MLDRVHRWMETEGAIRTEADDRMNLCNRVLLNDPNLRALQRGRQEGAEQLIAAEIARETGLAPDAIAAHALAGAITTTFLAMQQQHAQNERAGGESFQTVLPMLRAALAMLHADSRARGDSPALAVE